jgi:phage terminase small subunit
MALTPKQERFITEYMIDLNATQAAIRAGYSPKTAMEQGYQLLQKTSVKNMIEVEQNKRAGKVGLDSEWVLRRLKTISDRCIQEEPVLDNQGNPTGEYKFDSSGANKATELIGKHLGMFKDNVNLNANMSVQIVDDIE